MYDSQIVEWVVVWWWCGWLCGGDVFHCWTEKFWSYVSSDRGTLFMKTLCDALCDCMMLCVIVWLAVWLAVWCVWCYCVKLQHALGFASDNWLLRVWENKENEEEQWMMQNNGWCRTMDEGEQWIRENNGWRRTMDEGEQGWGRTMDEGTLGAELTADGILAWDMDEWNGGRHLASNPTLTARHHRTDSRGDDWICVEQRTSDFLLYSQYSQV